jgi:acylphosphatase
MMSGSYRIGVRKTAFEKGSSMTDNTLAIHVYVHGHVQGVFFRSFVLNKANELNITGWVHNTSSGAVEIQAEGSKETLDKLISELHVGPPQARVDRVDAEWDKAKGKFHGFRICYE